MREWLRTKSCKYTEQCSHINMKEIILIGGGGHCKSVIDVIEQEGKFKIVGIVDKPELIWER